ncbi:MAG: YccF domain-containing protein [Thermoleophilia bacterium]|nr:YccF domain-containing protein [Thermoleophilia bacterium]
MKTLLNILWLILAGVWMAILYVLAGALMAITIIGIPFAVQAFKLAVFTLWPFGRMLVPNPERGRGLSVMGNILWFILAGWWLALGHLFTGIVLCLTIIGIPLGIGSFKMAGAVLVPFGRGIVSTSDLARTPEGAVAF